MSTEHTPSWTPSTAAEKDFKDSILSLYSSNDKAVLPEDDGKPRRFVLHTKGFYDLRAYVLTGKQFPTSLEAFQEKMPRSAFSMLIDIDATIYEKTQDTMVEIGRTCTNYYNHQLPRLVTASSAAADYSQNTINMLDATQEISLGRDLNIILDPKYASVADQDATFKEAREAAQMTLTMLREDASAKEKEAKEIIQGLLTFKGDTTKAERDVQYLTQQYKTGPVDNRSFMKKPYLKFLNEELEADIEAFNKKVAEANETYDDWKRATAIACGTAFLGPIGWVVTGIEAAKAANLRAHYKELMERVRELKQERLEETTLIEYINQLTTQYADIDAKMTVAIGALSELASLFTQQVSCFDRLIVNLDGLWQGTDSDALVNRQAFIDFYMLRTIERLYEIMDLAREFSGNIINNVDLDKI